jgi:hypothetical protein
MNAPMNGSANLPGMLLLVGLLCWSLALVRAAIALLDTSATQRELQRAGLSAAGYLPLWCWLRVGLALGAGMAALWLVHALWPQPEWWSLPGCFGGLWLGWCMPPAALSWQARRRERRLGRGVTQLVERLAVALLCGAEPRWALQQALTRGGDAELGKLMVPLVAEPVIAVSAVGVRARQSGARRRQRLEPRWSAESDWQAANASAPAAVRGLARVMRRASQRSATDCDVERLRLTLQSWSHGYTTGAYDWQVAPPEPKVHELEDHSTIVLNSM